MNINKYGYRALVGISIGVVLIVGVVLGSGALLQAQDVPGGRQAERDARRLPPRHLLGEGPRVNWGAVENLIQAHEDVLIQEARVEAARARLDEAEHRLAEAKRRHSDGEDQSLGLLEAQARVKSRSAELLADRVGLQRAKRQVDRLTQRLEDPLGGSISVNEIEGIIERALEGARLDSDR